MPNATQGLMLRTHPENFYQTVPMAAATTIFHGTMVGVNATGHAGPAAPASVRVLGILDQGTDAVNSGAAGAATVAVKRGVAIQLSNSAAFPVTAAHIGQACTVEDDNTVSAPGTAARVAVTGRVLGVLPTAVVVAFE